MVSLAHDPHFTQTLQSPVLKTTFCVVVNQQTDSSNGYQGMEHYFFETVEIPPSARENMRASALRTTESRSSRSSVSNRSGQRSIVEIPPAPSPSAVENSRRHR